MTYDWQLDVDWALEEIHDTQDLKAKLDSGESVIMVIRAPYREFDPDQVTQPAAAPTITIFRHSQGHLVATYDGITRPV